MFHAPTGDLQTDGAFVMPTHNGIWNMSWIRQTGSGRCHPRPAWLVLAALFSSLLPGPVLALSQFMPPRANDRIAIVAPHPDDEVLATGGLIQQAVAVGAQVKVIYLTNGDHNQANFRFFSRHQHVVPDILTLGEQRRSEALDAMQLLGLTPENLTFLGYPDWWTMRLWQDYWDDDTVLYNNATDSTDVPYPENYGYRHTYRADSVIDDLYEVLHEFKPTRVFVTHPYDTNLDHRATANFVQLALLQLNAEGIRPSLSFYIVHFANWPTPLQYRPTLALEAPPTLRGDDAWLALPLTREQVDRKYHATLTNLTQVATQRSFLTAFTRANEIFANARTPAIPLLPAQAKLDWTKAVHLRALMVLPAQSGYETNGVAVLPSTTAATSLERIDLLRQEDALIVQINSRNLNGRQGGVRLCLFGGKQDIDFTSLPKVQINITPDGRLSVAADHEAVEDSGVTITNAATHMILRVPLKLLGGADIDYLFTSALAYFGAAITADTAWHLLRL